jgi:phosphoribosyl-AMP cyclohydrolase
MVTPDFDKGGGLLPTVVQDAASGRVLMLAYMNQSAWEMTLETGKAHYWSRSRGRIWLKGEQSGHFQQVQEVFLDCDRDTILLKVLQHGGAACHTGHVSCFYRRYHEGALEVVDEVMFDPEEVYGK